MSMRSMYQKAEHLPGSLIYIISSCSQSDLSRPSREHANFQYPLHHIVVSEQRLRRHEPPQPSARGGVVRLPLYIQYSLKSPTSLVVNTGSKANVVFSSEPGLGNGRENLVEECRLGTIGARRFDEECEPAPCVVFGVVMDEIHLCSCCFQVYDVFLWCM
jgi:hypothetical protein